MLSYFQAAYMNDKTAKKNTGKVKTVSCKCSDHQGDLVKDDLPVWIIGTDVKHIRIAVRDGIIHLQLWQWQYRKETTGSYADSFLAFLFSGYKMHR